MLLNICCFLWEIRNRNAGILVLILEFKFIPWSCWLPLWGQKCWSRLRMAWIFVREQLLVTFRAWGACLSCLNLSRFHLHILRCQNLLREHPSPLSHTRRNRNAALMGTRGAHCLAGNPGVALTSDVAQTMSSGLNFPPSRGSSIETVMISGAQGGHAQLQARRRSIFRLYLLSSKSSQERITSSYLQHFQESLSLIGSEWVTCTLLIQSLWPWKCNALIGVGLAHVLLPLDSFQMDSFLPFP